MVTVIVSKTPWLFTVNIGYLGNSYCVTKNLIYISGTHLLRRSRKFLLKYFVTKSKTFTCYCDQHHQLMRKYIHMSLLCLGNHTVNYIRMCMHTHVLVCMHFLMSTAYATLTQKLHIHRA